MRARHGLLVVAAMFAMACTLRADTTVTVNLGPSAQNFVDFGLGLNINGHGSAAAAQGACTEVGSNTECLMSGSFTGSSAGFTSGTYSFVTEYAGPDTPLAGPNGPVFASNSMGVNNLSHYFFIDPSTTMDLTLATSGGTFLIPLVTGGNFDPGTNFFFTFSNFACSGTAVSTCEPGDVFLTPGAIGSGSVTDVVSFSAPAPTATPEPSALCLLGTSLLGLASFRRKLFAR